MFETKTILIFLAILLLLFIIYKISNKSENLNPVSESKYSNFVQDFINSRKNNLNQFVLSDDFKFNITNDITSLNGNNENNLIYDNMIKYTNKPDNENKFITYFKEFKKFLYQPDKRLTPKDLFCNDHDLTLLTKNGTITIKNNELI